MTTPLALVLYENILPGSQLVIRLQDLGYRVHTLANAKELVEHAEREKPLVIMVDLISHTTDVCAALRELKNKAATSHIPVVAFLSQPNPELEKAGAEAGAVLVANDPAFLTHLPQLLDKALHID